MDNNQTNNQMNKENKQKNGRELFYGVIAIASFIVMAVGATFAYFTATASSANSSIGTGSTTLELQYISYGSAWSHYDLIPSDTTVTEYSVEYQNDTTAKQDAESTTYLANNTLCVDDYGNIFCPEHYAALHQCLMEYDAGICVETEISSDMDWLGGAAFYSCSIHRFSYVACAMGFY